MVRRQLRDWLRDPFYDLLEHFPARYCERVRTHRDQVVVVSPRSAIVIEGYQGSANSFARAAFLEANPSAEVASHVHTVAHIKYALSLGIPIMVLLREPEAAVASYVQRFTEVGTGRALTRYVKFHRELWPLRDKVLLVGFEVVTSDFGRAMTAANERFGTQFAPYVSSDAAREGIFGQLDEVAAGFDVASARPASSRSVGREALVAEIRSYRGGRALRAATESYERLRLQVPDELRVT